MLASKNPKNTVQSFVALVNRDCLKFVDKEYMKNVKEWIKMNALARLFEEEKIEAVNVAVSQNRKEIARKMLSSGDDIPKVMLVTGLTRAEIDEVLTPVGA